MARLPRLVDSADPFSYLRVAVGGLLVAGTLLALGLAVTGVAPRAILLVGIFWAIYGLLSGILDGVLDPMLEYGGRFLMNVGVSREEGYSGIESMVARGDHARAAEAYAEHAALGSAEAALRRAELQADQLHDPGMAARELVGFRDARGGAIRPFDDIRIGLALVELYDHRLQDPGRAMVELRRLIDRYPAARRVRQMRLMLQAFRRRRFGQGEPVS